MNDAAARSRCPRCGVRFTCGRDSEAPCPCTGVTLDAARLADLRRRYSGCLCLDCLRTLVQDATKLDPSQGLPLNAGDPLAASGA